MDEPVPIRKRRPGEKLLALFTYVLTISLLILLSIGLSYFGGIFYLVAGLFVSVIGAFLLLPELRRGTSEWKVISDEEFANDPQAQQDYREWYDKWLASLA